MAGPRGAPLEAAGEEPKAQGEPNGRRDEEAMDHLPGGLSQQGKQGRQHQNEKRQEQNGEHEGLNQRFKG